MLRKESRWKIVHDLHLIRVAITMMKHNNQKQLGRKRFIWLINSESLSVEGNHGRNSNLQELEGADSDATKDSAYSVATYIQPRVDTTQNRLEPPKSVFS